MVATSGMTTCRQANCTASGDWQHRKPARWRPPSSSCSFCSVRKLTDVRMAGRVFGAVKERLPAELHEDCTERPRPIDRAITRRNRLVHDTIEIGWSQQYGEYVPVIELLGGAEVSESSLREDLAVQQQATRAAVEFLIAIHESRTSPDAH